MTTKGYSDFLICSWAKSKSEKFNYIDECRVAVSVSLKECLVPDLEERPKPANFHERTGQILPYNNLLQYYIRDTEIFVVKNNMKINKEKSKIMIFSASKKYDFPPEFEFSDGSLLEVENQYKLLGVILSGDLKWYHNTNFITKKAMKRIWILRRLKKIRSSVKFMVEVYEKEILSLLEQAVPVWHSGLTVIQENAIERVQKAALYVILDSNYNNYENACAITGLTPLKQRREKNLLKIC